MVNSPLNLMLEWALTYAEMGWPVLPLHNPVDDSCSCGNPDCVTKRRVGKHPRIAGGAKNASCDPEQVKHWWKKWPDANIGIRTGPISRLLVLDVDGKAGLDSFRQLKHEKLFGMTLISRTGRTNEYGKRDGWHFVYGYPDGAKIGNSAGLLSKGIDVRGVGGYFIAPPSLHFSGLRYRWEDFEAEITMPRDRLIARLIALQTAPDEPLGTDQLHEGERNDKLYRMGKAFRRGGMKFDEVLRRLTEVNKSMCIGPLPQEEILCLARSAWKHAKVGPDPLEAAWQQVLCEKHRTLYSRFVSLARHAQRSQIGVPILLPVVHVGKIMDCHRTLVSRFRRRALRTGVMEVVGEYVPRRKATSFKVFLPN
jgi:putative DNA primase/helicase